MEDKELVMTVEQAAKVLHISRPSAYLGVRRGQIPSIKIGRRILISRRALEKMLEGQQDDNQNRG